MEITRKQLTEFVIKQINILGKIQEESNDMVVIEASKEIRKCCEFIYTVLEYKIQEQYIIDKQKLMSKSSRHVSP